METIIIRERYKVVRVIYTAKDYALVEAVDIQERETPLCLLNLYEGALLHRYGKLYTELRREDCPAFQRLFLDGKTLVAVFENPDGERIDRVFYRGDRWMWRERLDFTELLLHQALVLTNLPPEISCAAMLSDNVLFDLKERKLRLRFMVPPLEEMNMRELVLLTGDQVKKLLPERLTSTDAECAFLGRLERGEYRSVAVLYADWRNVRAQILAEREMWEKTGLIRKGLTIIKRLLKRKRR